MIKLSSFVFLKSKENIFKVFLYLILNYCTKLVSNFFCVKQLFNILSLVGMILKGTNKRSIKSKLLLFQSKNVSTKNRKQNN